MMCINWRMYGMFSMRVIVYVKMFVYLQVIILSRVVDIGNINSCK